MNEVYFHYDGPIELGARALETVPSLGDTICFFPNLPDVPNDQRRTLTFIVTRRKVHIDGVSRVNWILDVDHPK